jgi:hypothetical protein
VASYRGLRAGTAKRLVVENLERSIRLVESADGAIDVSAMPR